MDMALFSEKTSKGISPMIAVVLMIAFTVAVGSILSLWLTSLSTTQTTTTSSEAEKQTLCARSALVIDKVTSAFSSLNDSFNVTVTYTYGTEDLYYFNISLVDNTRDSLTVTPKIPSKNFNKTNVFSPGMRHTFTFDINKTEDVENATSTVPANAGGNYTGFDLTGSSLESVGVKAICQDSYPIYTECKSGQACMS